LSEADNNQADPKANQTDREDQIAAHLPLLASEARRIGSRLPAWVDSDDLASAGTIGLLSAFERFDPGRGLSFGAYARCRIRWAILDELRAFDQLPRRSRQKHNRLEKVRWKLSTDFGRPPTDEEQAQELDMTMDEYLESRKSFPAALDLSLDLIERGAGALAAAGAGRFASPDVALQRKELRQRLVAAIELLSERQRTVISMYYYGKLNYREIAVLLDVTESRICQIHRQACESLRTFLDGDEEHLSERGLRAA